MRVFLFERLNKKSLTTFDKCISKKMTNATLKKVHQRRFYQILMNIAFAICITHGDRCILRFLLHFYIIIWLISIHFCSIFNITMYKNNMTVANILEEIQYNLDGIMYCLILIVFIVNKTAIVSTFNSIQTDFVRWSIKRESDPNKAYDKSVLMIYRIIVPILIAASLPFIGPFLAAINDLGTVPLDDRSHFLLFWPKIVEINNFITYIIIYSLQVMFTILLYPSALFNFGFMVILYEVNNQVQLLLDGVQEAFVYRMDQTFQKHFIDCIFHHQIIIKFVDNFGSYFKWIIFIEIIILQGIFAICIYVLTKVDASYGYTVKIIGIICMNLFPFCFHCHIGEDVLNMHKLLARQLYDMTWYDMPNENKQLIIIMYQRTQKDLSLNSALFAKDKASRKLISKVIKQVYTLLNVMLKS